MEEIVGIGVLRELGGHGTNDANVIGAFSDEGEEVTDLEAAFAVMFEFPWAGEDFADAVKLGRLHLHVFVGVLAVVLGQHGLGVEGVHMGYSAIHVEEDDAFGFGLVVRFEWSQRRKTAAAVNACGIDTGKGWVLQQGLKGESSKTNSAVLQKITAGSGRGEKALAMVFHGFKKVRDY